MLRVGNKLIAVEQMDAPTPRPRRDDGLFEDRSITLHFQNCADVDRLMMYVAGASPERPVALGWQVDGDARTIEFDVVDSRVDGLSAELTAKPFFRGVA